MTDAARPHEARLSHVVVVALLPALVFAIGEGAIIPVIPTVAASMGAGIEFAGFIAGAIMIGQTLGNLPAGPVVARIGEKRAMLAGAGLAVAGAVVSALAANAWVLLVGILVIGCSAAVFNLARHAFLTSYAPLEYRARVLSTLGGVFRAGQFVGPLLSAGVIAISGLAHAAFWIFLVCAALVIVVLLVGPDLERTASPAGSEAGEPGAGSGQVLAAVETAEPRPAAARERTSVWSAIRRHREVLTRLGVGSGLIALLRGARGVVLPLWAVSIGMDPAPTALVIGISGGVDFALFFTSGWIMDRFGRAWSAVPSMIGMGAGLIALACTPGLPGPQGWFVALAVWIGVFNGIGSGIIMTLGADLAPQAAPAPFLGAWHFITDGASALVPVLVAGVTALVSLSATAGALGVIGLVGAGMMWRWIPRYVPRAPR